MTQRGTFSSEPVVGRHVVAQTTYPRTMAMDENQHFGASINEPSVIDYHTYLVKSGYNIEPLLFSNYHRRAFSMYNTDRQPTVDVTFLLACRDGSLFQLKTVIQRGPSPATVNQQDHCGRTGLNHVCANGQLAMLQLLADLPDLDPNLPDNEGCTPLMMASQAGHVEIVTFLLRVFRETIVVDQRNVFGVTALMKASLQGRGRCVKVLLASGANSLLRDPSRKFCSLDWARFCGRQSCVEILEKFMKTTVGKACLANQQKIGGSKDKWSSDPDLQSPLHSNASLPDIHTGKTTSKHVGGENGWFKQKLRKTFKYSDNKTRRSADFSIFNNITAATMLCASSAILQNVQSDSNSSNSDGSQRSNEKKIIIPKVELPLDGCSVSPMEITVQNPPATANTESGHCVSKPPRTPPPPPTRKRDIKL